MRSDDPTTTRPSAPVTTSSTRLHSLDGLRGTLMVIGVPYHAAVVFSGDTWVAPGEQSPVLMVLWGLVHLWRMPAFFVVAGFFAVLVLRRRDPGTWFRGRARRLGVPLLFGLLLLNPLQALLVARHRSGDWGTAVDRWTTGVGSWTGIYHLWFLIVLLLYCAGAAVLLSSPWRAPAARVAAAGLTWAQATVGRTVAVLGAAGVVVVLGLAIWRASGIGGLLGGVVTSEVVLYVPAFVIGAALALRPQDLRRASAGWPVLALVGGVCLVVHVAESMQTWQSPAGAALVAAADTTGGLAVALLILGGAARVADRRSRLVDWVVDASLPIYLVHYVLVVACAVWLLPTGIDAVAGWALAVALLVPACVLAYEAINAVPVLRLLATGRRSRGTTLAQVLTRRPRPAA
ncbi:acyltransferase family protein [Cellulomonas aerilata]|uniref:Glucan biosynthesis protein n=1 Tax=Cellulomonas aerilata TaxID=515326 RepID=A0A512D8F9_9CELL|nr:acyltransferase family protein [Cellulomonas aerilata]GEO32687.1 glucan biosynthesis protein [Cellulomonas aerilata]